MPSSNMFSLVIFNPRSPCGERRHFPGGVMPISHFNPRSPCGSDPVTRRYRQPRISIRAPLAGSDVLGFGMLFNMEISIRAPPCGERPDRDGPGRTPLNFNPRSLAGSDNVVANVNLTAVISIRAPLAGSDSLARASLNCLYRFQSALPLRGATIPHQIDTFVPMDFNPRSPCGERPLYFVASLYYQQNIVVSKTVAANSSGKSRKTAAELATT